MTASGKTPKVDPADLDGLRRVLSSADPDGRLAEIGLSRVEIGPEAIRLVSEVVTDFVGDASEAKVLLAVDSTPKQRAGQDPADLVESLLGERFSVERVVLGAGSSEELHADDQTLEEAGTALAGADCVVVAGSGTITDVCKVATARLGNTPLVVVQTAASVNGYADDVSVLLKSGVKRTVPSRWPDALISDLTTLADAPPTMNASGYGDAIAMYTGPADWCLASLMGLDDSYQPGAIEMVLDYGPALIEDAAAVRNREPEALARLVRALTLGGMAAGATGTTACLSGTEHMVSHLLDMNAGKRDLRIGFHGAQVGVASVVVAAAWEVLFEELDPSEVDVDACFPEHETMEPVVRGAFEELDPTGEIGAECWSDYGEKLTRWRNHREDFENFLHEWPRYREQLSEMLLPPERLAGPLTEVGAPARFGDLDPPASPRTARWAIHNCLFMRNRFTIADLLFFLGWWDEAFVERLLDRARAAGGGL